jgi:diguanylate cyclase (GGDEF)-like protein
MEPLRIDPLAPLAQQLTAARRTLIDRLLFGATWMAVAMLPLLLWRASEVGWHAQLRVQAAALVAAIVLGLVRRRLPLGLKVGLMLAVTSSLGVSGVLTLGMTGTGYFWLLLSATFFAVFVSLRSGIVATALSAGVLAVAGIGFVGGVLRAPIDLQAHATSASGWVSFLVVLAVVPLVVMYAAGGIQQHLIALLAQLRDQRDELEAQRVELLRLASHDELTGLPLARLALDRLEMALHAAQRRGEKVGVLFVDLDGFKAVNDRHGHLAGDALLRAVAQRLRAAVRAEDTVARVGGDEFVVVAVEQRHHDDALRVAHKLVDEIGRPFVVGGATVRVGASVGLAMFPDDAPDAESLRRRADAAMYRAKNAGGARVVTAASTPADDGAPVVGDGRAGALQAAG